MMKHSIGSKERPLNVAVIGSGPSGFYIAESLLKQEEFYVEVDMFERLPTPYGLVRAGVAPDHQQIKSVSKIYEKIAQLPQFRFWGNVHFGTDIQKDDIMDHFDAVVYAVGAQSDRSMGIPGEEFRGSYSATEFVGWYNGHPDFEHLKFDFSSNAAAVIGMGNVAMDIARILARTPEELSKTDIAKHAQKQLSQSNIRNIYLIARRGPMQSAFTSAGTKEIPKLSQAVAVVEPSELKLEDVSKKILENTKEKRIIQNLEFLETISKNRESANLRSIRFLFRRSPLEILGKDGIVNAIKIVKNELFKDDFGALKARATEVSEVIEVGLVFRSIGYRVKPLPGVSFDSQRGVIANENGRVMNAANGKVCPGEYVVGWAKRGPTGIIGTNKSDAVETSGLLIEDYKNQQADVLTESRSQVIVNMLQSKKIHFVPFEDWKILDKVEIEVGEKKSKPREKITTVKEMLEIIKAEK